MSSTVESVHDRAILKQFTETASGFAASPELHTRDVLNLMVDAAAPRPKDVVIDLACGPGSVACAFAEVAGRVVGLDSTPAMLDEARALAANKGLSNTEWTLGSVYDVPYAAGSFDIVTCRFAFHHLTNPPAAFAEMMRLAAPGGRIVLCDAVASDDPAKAEAFNAWERWRDPSTVEFRTLGYLTELFTANGLGAPEVRRFQVGYLASDLVRTSFPDGGDHVALLAALEKSADGDTFDMSARQDADGVRVAFHAVVLTTTKRLDRLSP